MPDYRTLFDDKWLKAWDLGGKEFTLTIERVVGTVVEDKESKKKERKPALWFKGAKKPLLLNKTNAKTVATLYGLKTEGWVDRPVTIYPTRTKFGRDEVDCIRIRPTVKGKVTDGMPEVAPPADREPGSDDDAGGAHASA